MASLGPSVSTGTRPAGGVCPAVSVSVHDVDIAHVLTVGAHEAMPGAQADGLAVVLTHHAPAVTTGTS